MVFKRTMNPTQARQNFYQLIQSINDHDEVIQIEGKTSDKSVVMISVSQYEQLLKSQLYIDDDFKKIYAKRLALMNAMPIEFFNSMGLVPMNGVFSEFLDHFDANFDKEALVLIGTLIILILKNQDKAINLVNMHELASKSLDQLMEIGRNLADDLDDPAQVNILDTLMDLDMKFKTDRDAIGLMKDFRRLG